MDYRCFCDRSMRVQEMGGVMERIYEIFFSDNDKYIRLYDIYRGKR